MLKKLLPLSAILAMTCANASILDVIKAPPAPMDLAMAIHNDSGTNYFIQEADTYCDNIVWKKYPDTSVFNGATSTYRYSQTLAQESHTVLCNLHYSDGFAADLLIQYSHDGVGNQPITTITCTATDGFGGTHTCNGDGLSAYPNVVVNISS